MLRRKPTRLELKIDDTAEFESVKKELEVESFNEYQTIPTEHFSFTLIVRIGTPQDGDVSATTDAISVFC